MNFLEGRIDADGERLTFVGRGFTLAVPDEWRGPFGSWVGRAVTLGLRPEHVRLGGSIPAVVEAVERLGAESQVYLRSVGPGCRPGPEPGTDRAAKVPAGSRDLLSDGCGAPSYGSAETLVAPTVGG